jgi:small subunit ribosomal protein S28e
MSSEKLAAVVKIVGKTGSRGGLTQVRAEILEDHRTVLRNVKGAIKEGDLLWLLESEREAKRIR